jgi:hypothetical protein
MSGLRVVEEDDTPAANITTSSPLTATAQKQDHQT